ncbi:MAG: hypothetical protein J6B69_07200 [Lachnospiraceae bacterium]|nr:hypothetical protein [Lachnospiraceae bacterium]
MSSTRAKNEWVTLEEWEELGKLLKDWEPYVETVKKRSRSAVELYMQREYGMDCSQSKTVDFQINKVVYRTLVVMTYRREMINLGLSDSDVVSSRILGQIERLLSQGRGEFSKNPAKRMKDEDGRVLELCRKYLKSVGLWLKEPEI